MGKGDAGKFVKSSKGSSGDKPKGKTAAKPAVAEKPASKATASKAEKPAKGARSEAPVKAAVENKAAKGVAPKVDKPAKGVTPKADKPAKAATPKADKPAKAAAAKVAEPESVPPPSAEGSGVVRKKKNVKRGAPPMLPRRNMKREIPPPGSPPPPPRAPMMPGSLHAPARAPEGADLIKKKLGTINNLLTQLKGMKRSIGRQFFEVGIVLTKLADPDLYKTRNYASFDAFVEREIEREINIGRSEVAALVRIVKVFQRDAAEEIGLEKLRAALKVLYPDASAPAS
jgi:hypothetical protein